MNSRQMKLLYSLETGLAIDSLMSMEDCKQLFKMTQGAISKRLMQNKFPQPLENRPACVWLKEDIMKFYQLKFKPRKNRK